MISAISGGCENDDVDGDAMIVRELETKRNRHPKAIHRGHRLPVI
jgi:hypothetical protein